MPSTDTQLMTVFSEALERTDPAARAAYLDGACPGEPRAPPPRRGAAGRPCRRRPVPRARGDRSGRAVTSWARPLSPAPPPAS